MNTEYVYSRINDEWTKHPIVKKTQKFVLVKLFEFMSNTMRLDRNELEQNNKVWRNKSPYGYFYNEIGKAEFDNE